MPLYKNVSQALRGLKSRDIRFTAIALPEQFNLWFEARKQLAEANPGHDLNLLDPVAHTIGMLTSPEDGAKGFMVIMPKSRYFTSQGSV